MGVEIKPILSLNLSTSLIIELRFLIHFNVDFQESGKNEMR